jgi:uncharacterized protein GlcG (DUF336 family)
MHAELQLGCALAEAEKEIEMLTLSQASAIVDHALAYARGHDLAPMAIAALDARGCIVALKTEDGSGLMRPDIAVGKAWGALGMGFGTRNLAGREHCGDG